MKYKIRKDDDGYIVVETIGAFIPFLLLVISVLSLVNIVAVQARMHFALTQAAKTLSMYCYTLNVLGIDDELMAMANKGGQVGVEANAMKGDIESLLSALDSLSGGSAVINSGNAANRALGWAEEAAGDPKEALQLLMNYGLREAGGSIFELLARPLVGRYLANGSMTGDEYLISSGVINSRTGAVGTNALEFHRFGNLGVGNSELLTGNGDVKLVAEYEILYTFGRLPLPFQPTLKITQTVVTKAWLNGRGEGYRK